jgi:hypothetical protein
MAIQASTGNCMFCNGVFAENTMTGQSKQLNARES